RRRSPRPTAAGTFARQPRGHDADRVPGPETPNSLHRVQRTRRANQEFTMLHYAVVFFVIALIAALFGFGGIAAGAAGIAKVLFVLFVILAVASFLFGRNRGV